jgi:hypothetical protein
MKKVYSTKAMDHDAAMFTALDMLTNLEKQVKQDVKNTSCAAGRKTCIDCSFQEIRNTLNRTISKAAPYEDEDEG